MWSNRYKPEKQDSFLFLLSFLAPGNKKERRKQRKKGRKEKRNKENKQERKEESRKEINYFFFS